MKIEEYLVTSTVRLDLFLRNELKDYFKDRGQISNSKIRRLVMAGKVSVNGAQCRVPAWTLHSGDRLSVNIEEEKIFFEKQPDDISFTLTEDNVLYEDEYIILVNKPAFFPVEETIAGKRDNLHAAVIDYLWKKNPSLRNPPYVGIMHRLDRETSGVILFTKQRCANQKCFDMFEKHMARKTYAAVCTQKTSEKSAFAFHRELLEGRTVVVENYIGRTSSLSSACTMGVVQPKPESSYSNKKYVPQKAVTEITLTAEENGRFYFQAKPLTGRTHQIRVHLSWCGFPICGDELYGGTDRGRILLHAQSLSFDHPVTGEHMTVNAPLPQGFEP